MFGWLPFEFEQAVGEQWSVFAGPQLRPFAGVGALTGTKGWGGRLSVGARFFPLDRAPAGFWIAAELVPEFNFVDDVDGDGLGFTDREWALSSLGMIGYSFIFDSGFTASGGLGFGVGYFDDRTTRDDGSGDNFRGLRPQFGVHANFGWAF